MDKAIVANHEAELARQFNCVEALLAHPDIALFEA
jgi:hypothetical protein